MGFGKPVLSLHASWSLVAATEDLHLLQLHLLVLCGCGTCIWVVDPTLGSKAARMPADVFTWVLVQDLRPSDLPTSADASGPSAFPS